MSFRPHIRHGRTNVARKSGGSLYGMTYAFTSQELSAALQADHRVFSFDERSP
jgi:hypothetical protein